MGSDSPKEWAERFEPVRREPRRPHRSAVAATIVLGAVLLTLAISYLLLLTGVLVWR